MSAPPPPPPPRRTVASSSGTTSPAAPTWKSRSKAWGMKAMEKSIVVSDWAGHKLNTAAEKIGSEAFFPVTDDFPNEMNKAARILRSFTVDGIETTIETEVKGIKRQRKVLRKIPPKVINSACGLAIFTSMRSGIAPFGGAGGAGVVVARLEDGSWSAPSSMSPNSLTAGFLIGVDIYDAVLVIRTPEALKSFASHKATLGTDIGVSAGPFGAGAAVEVGMEKAPVLSYTKSRGFYAGVQLVGQVFVERFDENGKMYHWPGVKAGDILSGKVRVPMEAAQLQKALADACSGKAQRLKHDALDVIVYPEVPVELVLEDGEVLKLPPTPSMTPPSDGEEDARPPKRAPADFINFSNGSSDMSESERKEREQDFNDRFAAASILPPPALPSRRPAPKIDTNTAVEEEELRQIQQGLNPHGPTGEGDVKLVSPHEVNQSNSTSPIVHPAAHANDLDFDEADQLPPPLYDESDTIPPQLSAGEKRHLVADEKVDPSAAPISAQSSLPPALPPRVSPQESQHVEEDDVERREREQHEANLKADAEEAARRKSQDEGEMTSVVI